MLIPGETFNESYAAAPESVAAARNALTEFARDAGADDEQLDAIRLAASEAVTNAVRHAYSDTAGRVQVSASYVEDELWLLIADAGDGLRPRPSSPGLGLGLVLIAQLADEFQILSRGSGGTELRLRFKLSAQRRSDRALAERDRSHGQSRKRGSLSSALVPASASFSTTQ
jgi:anti-sigma regulatory factor (Ser/Thr protein kinase)